jgi:hypothetical protein
VRRFLAAYGPATTVNFAAWLSRSGRNAKRWFGPENDVQEVEVDGHQAYIRAEDADGLAAARPSRTVRLLGGFDQWVLGPGTGDTSVLAAGRRAAVSKTAGWIAPIVVVGGVVHGTWELDRKAVRVAWFSEAGSVPKASLREEVARLSSVFGQPLELAVESV